MMKVFKGSERKGQAVYQEENVKKNSKKKDRVSWEKRILETE